MATMNEKVSNSTQHKGPRPRYRFCWWCSRKLQGHHHRTMRATVEAAGGESVIVHVVCSESMIREGGWEDLRGPD